jgi:hypothetical protein
MATLRNDLHDWFEESRQRLGSLSLKPRVEHIGRVVQVGDGVATVDGLPNARLDELLLFEGGVRGLAMELGEEKIGCVLMGDASGIASGSIVRGTAEVARTPVGDGLLGRVVDPLGSPLDGGEAPKTSLFSPIEQAAPAIVDRALVTRPLATGFVVIDAMIPLGRGQRELIIGDGGTGKTAIATDAIINQRSSDVICVYVAIGQKSSSVVQVVEAVRRYGAPERCLFVVGEADAAPGLQWLAPYAACAMSEYFMRKGRDVLLVLDDLTKHAAIYRQISLLLRRPPGREAFPGDIFYIHSRLLERAAQLAPGSRRRFSHRAANSGDAGQQHQRLHSDKSDLDHRWPDLSRLAAVLRKPKAGGRRWQERVPCWRQDPSPGSEVPVRDPSSRLCAIPGVGSVYPLRRHGRRADAKGDRAWATDPRGGRLRQNPQSTLGIYMNTTIKSSVVAALFMLSTNLIAGDTKAEEIRPNIIGKTYLFEYGDYAYDITISSDNSLHWKLVKGSFEGPDNGDNPYLLSKIADGIIFFRGKKKVEYSIIT